MLGDNTCFSYPQYEIYGISVYTLLPSQMKTVISNTDVQQIKLYRVQFTKKYFYSPLQAPIFTKMLYHVLGYPTAE